MENNFTLDKFQQEAIDYANNGHSIIVSAPTGAGKTLIAEYIIEECIKNNKGVIYTAPIKALSNQKYRDFCKKYPQDTGILTGDVSINRNAAILIMTTEIFRNAILVNPDEFKNREWIIFDEIHYLDDIERGTVWEEAIILLPQTMKMLALSATIPNIQEFTDWLKKIHKFPLGVVIEKTRPVPLHFFFQCDNQLLSSFSELKKSNLLLKEFPKYRSNMRLPIVRRNRLQNLLETFKKNKTYPCLYFAFSRRRCEDLAREVAYFDFLTAPEKEQIGQMFHSLLEKFNISSSHISFLEPLVKKGIAYHHAGLLPTLKEVIEQLFASGLIKIIFTTETFALGINMPVKTVVFDSLRKFYGRYHDYLRVRDFYQMAGRAGRRGIDQEGFVVSRVNPFDVDLMSLESIIYGHYEPIVSQLNSCYATIINLYKIMGEKIYDIYPNSFHFYQANDFEKKNVLNLLKQKIYLLKSMKYILPDGISWKADLASKVYSFELPIGELFEKGYLDSLTEHDLFILMTALVYEPRKGERKPILNKTNKRLKKDLGRFLKDINQVERRYHVYPESKRLYFHLCELASQWFRGENFYDISKNSEIDEGEIVRYFRMSIQVLREIYTSQIISDALKQKILNVLRKVNRDVIDAEKQLRQEI